MKQNVSQAMQKFSRSVIVPVKFLAVMGIFLAFSVILQLQFMPQPIQSLGLLLKSMMDSMLNNLALIFCVGIASSMANRKKVEAALLSLLSFLVFLAANHAWLEMTGQLAKEGEVGLFGTGQAMVLGFQVIDMNVFLGILIGCLVAYFHNRFSEKSLHEFLSIYGGTRYCFILLVPVLLVLAIVMCYIWPVIYRGISSFSGFILSAGLVGVFVYAFGNRFLVPTGLHHLLWMPFCFTSLGGTLEINGQVYSGAVNIFYAQLANAKDLVALDPSLRFATFGFAKIFASVAVALALIHCAAPERKKEVRGMILPSAFVGFMAGITEPLDFSFLFASPLLWLVHSLLTAISETLLWAMGARTYMLFGFIDSFVNNAALPPSLTKFYLVLLMGLVMGVIWYFVFVFLIRRYNLPTPGREQLAQVPEEANRTESLVLDQGSREVPLQEEARATLLALGGAGNIEYLTNCFTRLRVRVKDASLVNEEALKNLSRAKGLFRKEQEIQVIIGMGVQAFREAVDHERGEQE